MKLKPLEQFICDELFPVVINGAKNGRQKVYHFGDGDAEKREYGVIFYLSMSEVAH